MSERRNGKWIDDCPERHVHDSLSALNNHLNELYISNPDKYNYWGTEKSLINSDEVCVECESGLPYHYMRCPLRMSKARLRWYIQFFPDAKTCEMMGMSYYNYPVRYWSHSQAMRIATNKMRTKKHSTDVQKAQVRSYFYSENW
jgi:hypothetical protein